MTIRSQLISELRDTILPELKNRGFAEIGLLPDEVNEIEYSRTMPFGRLRRMRGDVYDLLEIDLDKHGAPEFRIMFGSFPETGIDHPYGHVKADEMAVGYLPHFGTLRSTPWRSLWFKPRSAFGRTYSRQHIRGCVEKACVLLTDVDAYLTEQRPSKHIRDYKAAYSKRST